MEFIPHTGNSCPVPSMTVVSYRTVVEIDGIDNISAHGYFPMLAGRIDWTNRPVVGRIHSYRVIEK